MNIFFQHCGLWAFCLRGVCFISKGSYEQPAIIASDDDFLQNRLQAITFPMITEFSGLQWVNADFP